MFKKIVAFIGACIIGVSVAACSTGAVSGKEEKTVFVSEPQKGITSELTYYHVDDDVLKQTLKNTLDFTQLDVDKDAVTAQIKELAKQYQGIKGIDHKVDISENKIVETATIDYLNLDFEKAKNVPGIILNGSSKKIGLKASRAALESQGYSEKK